jgi:demethylmenaquinone methyltransferase/2-methoxy-6-polyprenyl-1,4-benzoquinol methylase
MLEVARATLGDRAELHLSETTGFPYDDGQFDLIITMLVLHELPSATRTTILNEAKRTLRAEGRLLLIDFHPGPIRGLNGWRSKIMITLSEILAGREHFRNYREFMAHKGLPTLVAAHDLTVDKERIVAGGNFGLFLLHSN